MPRPPHRSPHTRMVLETLLRTFPDTTHGYDLSKATGLKSGTLYPILQRLHEQGHLDADWEPSPLPGKPPRHVYKLSERGLTLARELTARSVTTSAKGALL